MALDEIIRLNRMRDVYKLKSHNNSALTVTLLFSFPKKNTIERVISPLHLGAVQTEIVEGVG